ncbi:MAG: arylsulfatase [Planctomycetaceae bacterium]|nr:arylsulfatase [Planctomycetaceae bacterium]
MKIYQRFPIVLSTILLPLILLGVSGVSGTESKSSQKPNIVLIYTDDIGYGDISCNGGEIPTPNIDRLAKQGVRFTNAHSTSSTCTPSRYGLLTGEYPWRRQGTGIAPGNAGSIITPDRFTLASMLQKGGYKTAAVGKWHLGLGDPKTGPNWNGTITGPREIGFDYNFLIPATGDRVPCVFVENNRIANFDPNDPIEVNYGKKVGNEPTGRENPELLIMKAINGHDQTIINGIGRIGFMSGGKLARWNDETIAETITGKAVDFIKANKNVPFFVYFATHDIHVPRVPHSKFAGKSGHGVRGDVILQLDDSVGTIVKTLEELNLLENTLIVFSSDNGPAVLDGYADGSAVSLGNHKPTGQFRGSKYSKFEAGTRVPLIVHWSNRVKPKVSDALVSHIDLFASFAALVGQVIPEGAAPDSLNSLSTLLGESDESREFVVEQGNGLAIYSKGWKLIPATQGAAKSKPPKPDAGFLIESGIASDPQLYNICTDIAETENLAEKYPDIVKELTELLRVVRENNKSVQ